MKVDPFKGEVKIAANSSLRKLARAMRRGLPLGERQFLIDMAMHRAKERHGAYCNSSPAHSAYIAKRDAERTKR